MTFRVGQKVVCVDDTDPVNLKGVWDKFPVLGTVYTVVAVGLFHSNDPDQLPCIHVCELDREIYEPIWAHRFRPAVERKTDISIFKEILNTDHLDNRRRIVVPEPCPVDGWGKSS